MLVSWNWLSRYVDLSMDREELEQRLSLSGLNHEGTETSDQNPSLAPGDVCIDLEVTSNRGDCLGHIGVAREIAVLYDQTLKTPTPQLRPGTTTAQSLLSVENRFPEACPRYTARVIQGVTIGPSPDWMIEALQAVFWKRRRDGKIEPYQPINNVVDATNYVLMECGQPLHAFDLAKVEGQQIIVRPAEAEEIITAIDHRQYELDRSMCVIADAKRAQAVAGVMGGADSEVTDSTRDVVIESAIFTPLSVRRTARALKLHSPSSYRFERRVDPVGIDWASQRVCELIVESAGGTVAEGVLDTAPEIERPEPIVLRLSQLERILGISISPQEVDRILTALGCESDGKIKAGSGSFVAPSWRHDLTREADLVEEVARVHGYDQIPEDSPIPVTPSSKRTFDTATEKVRGVLTAAGLSEAMTPSVVTKKLDASLSPWTDRPALSTQTAMLKGAKKLRRTLLPSLIQARADNWAAASIEANLFELAHLYLPGKTAEDLPEELYAVGMVTGADFFAVKGMVESLCRSLGTAAALTVKQTDADGFVAGQLVQLSLGDARLGYLGVVSPKTLKQWKLPSPVVVAELSLPQLLSDAQLVPQQTIVSTFPTVQRDLNFIVAESVRWNELESVVRSAVGDRLKEVTYLETYRDPDKDGQDRKRVLLSVQLQRDDATLSGEEADSLVQNVIGDCKRKLNAELLG
ncbi:phenylalanine--tRNA ligase subunit beta [Roseiconus nitratireducens]|uniref:Phenylalanine--tRNA ligase beta subunit n=1 Tax=Roseiconus nitratireducens TaxID=2605748 RepID=A0A5M6DM81_9BACT|nr:phenylalanine--tRNA ligase subunit beta [Roseiconus nitratireducens]KAA5547240.1 phenylalanine--tRNA ligase subunit beta [Roseiconus nitratireducens]